nr:MerR family transcriptional regulator [Pseudohalocynthiibacter aestuariivivens]
MAKSADAFRTISEVADWLGIPAHVLRFWESKFTQVKPVKRAGGRRYYRPADMQLLGGIRKLLHEDGMTIKGVQKILREQGVKEVSALSPLLDANADDGQEISGIALDVPDNEVETRGKVLNFERDKPQEETAPTTSDSADTTTPEPDTSTEPAASADTDVPPPPAPDTAEPTVAADSTEPQEEHTLSGVSTDADTPAATEPPEQTPVTPSGGTHGMPSFLKKSLEERGADADDVQTEGGAKPENDSADAPEVVENAGAPQHDDDSATADTNDDVPDEPDATATKAETKPEQAPTHEQSQAEPEQATTDETATSEPAQDPEPEAVPEPVSSDTPEAPRATPISTPPDPEDDELQHTPSALSALAGLPRATPAQAAALSALADRLRALHTSPPSGTQS